MWRIGQNVSSNGPDNSQTFLNPPHCEIVIERERALEDLRFLIGFAQAPVQKAPENPYSVKSGDMNTF